MVVLKPGMESFAEWPNISGKWKLLKLGEVGAHEQQWTLSPPRSVVAPWVSYKLFAASCTFLAKEYDCVLLKRQLVFLLKFNHWVFLQWYILGTNIGPTTPSLYHQITGVFSSISFIVATLHQENTNTQRSTVSLVFGKTCEMKPVSLDFGSWWKIKACRYSYTPRFINCMYYIHLHTPNFEFVKFLGLSILSPFFYMTCLEIPGVRVWVLRKTQPWPSPSTKLADATAISFISLPFL